MQQVPLCLLHQLRSLQHKFYIHVLLNWKIFNLLGAPMLRLSVYARVLGLGSDMLCSACLTTPSQ